MTRTLCVIETPTMIDVIANAKKAISESDYNFKAEIDTKPDNRHASIVVRRAIRDFHTNLSRVTQEQWESFSLLYQKHRQSDTLDQIHLRIMEDGEDRLDAIRAYIASDPNIYEIMSVKVAGIQIPSAMLIICALAWVSENTYRSPARENPHF